MTEIDYGSQGLTTTGEGETSGSTTGEMQQRAQEKAQQVTSQAQEKAQQGMSRANEQLKSQLDTRSTQAGEPATSVADAARRTGESLRSEGKEQEANVVEQLAERVERLGNYLRETSGDRMMQDIEDFGRRQPWAIAALGAVAGFFGARFLKASSGGGGASSDRRGMGAGMRSGYEPALPPATGPDAVGVTPASTGAVAPTTGPYSSDPI